MKRVATNVNLVKQTSKPRPFGYWKNSANIQQFLNEIKQIYNVTTPEDWNSITTTQIQSHGGWTLLKNYSMYDIKCMGCPEGKLKFEKPKPSIYWDKKENIQNFLHEIKQKYNISTIDDWKLSISSKKIRENGGRGLLLKYSMNQLIQLSFPSEFGDLSEDIKTKKNSDNLNLRKPFGYWENQENVFQFLHDFKLKFNLNSPEDWNLVSQKQIKAFGGWKLLLKYSMYEIKCFACPEGKYLFDEPNQSKPPGYWDNKENIDHFLNEIKQKYNLNTPEDWNSLSRKQIILNGGRTLLTHCSIYELKCMACPEGKFMFDKPPGYWDNKENIDQFLNEIKQKYNLNTPEDWNTLSQKLIESLGGSGLLKKYSLFDLKCLGCHEGKYLFDNQNISKPPGYWDEENNRNHFFEKLKCIYHLKTPCDWQRLSKAQIISFGGRWLYEKEYFEKSEIKFEISNNNKKTIVSKRLKELISVPCSSKRSSQRWLFLQVKKLFPGEEILEDYFHSEIYRETGNHVQFDIFLINRNLAIEYHGEHHYQDIPNRFATLEMYKNRDLEKKKLCEQFGIRLVTIPYWWDNKLDSLRVTLSTTI